jgi:hypothetical protein
MEVGGQPRDPAALPPLKGPQSRSRRGGEEKNPRPCWESNSGHPVRSLYWLSYPLSTNTVQLLHRTSCCRINTCDALILSEQRQGHTWRKPSAPGGGLVALQHLPTWTFKWPCKAIRTPIRDVFVSDRIRPRSEIIAAHASKRASSVALHGVSKSFWTELITKSTTNTRWEATQRVMAAKLTRLTHKIAIQLHLVVESCTICSSRSRRSDRKLLDTPHTSCRTMGNVPTWCGNCERAGNEIPILPIPCRSAELRRPHILRKVSTGSLFAL